MKYMKLGSKPDIFELHGNVVTAMNDLPPDLELVVGGMQFHLHKYPLLLKCGYLRRMVLESSENGSAKIQVKEIPGGRSAFEVCAKFCYGIAVTINAFNIVAVCCAAQHLEMTEEMEKGNLVFKSNYFLDFSILHAWKDSIISLQSTAALLPWAEDLKLVDRCIDSIVSKVSVKREKVNWSFTYTRSLSSSSTSCKQPDSNNGSSSEKELKIVPEDWWAEDICRLDIDLYQRVMSAIKSKGRVSSNAIWQALMVYASRCLSTFMFKDHNSSEAICQGEAGHSDGYMEMAFEHKRYLEAIVALFPVEKGPSSCSFLLKLLKAASLLGAAVSLKMDLERRVAEQLEDASMNDLLIPSFSYASESMYDVDLIQSILKRFMDEREEQRSESPPTKTERASEIDSADTGHVAENQTHASSVHSSMLKVAKLVDSYLAEIARDANLTVTKFIDLVELVPDFARPVHDDLYKAIDVYLKEHNGLTKAERKRICRLLDCKKLSMDVCLHAAQNDRLPLRTVVQVLFFEQVRSSMANSLLTDDASSIKSETVVNGNAPQSGYMSEDEWDSSHGEIDASKEDNADSNKRAVEGADKDAESGGETRNHSSSTRRKPFPAAVLGKVLSTLNRARGSGMSYC